LQRIELLWSESIEGLEASKAEIKVHGRDGSEMTIPGDLRARAAFLREGRGILELAGAATGAWGGPGGGPPAEINLALIVGIPRGSAGENAPEVRQLGPSDVTFTEREASISSLPPRISTYRRSENGTN
jgi:hypothetical protein